MGRGDSLVEVYLVYFIQAIIPELQYPHLVFSELLPHSIVLYLLLLRPTSCRNLVVPATSAAIQRIIQARGGLVEELLFDALKCGVRPVRAFAGVHVLVVLEAA